MGDALAQYALKGSRIVRFEHGGLARQMQVP
jgi:hypothetical protein